MTHSTHQPKTKQHAQRRDVYRRYPLWVYDDADWETMRGLPTGDLICVQKDCRAELVPAQITRTGTRFLRNRPGTKDCGHAFGRSTEGGPPSAEHRWFRQRIAKLCDALGYETIQGHADSRADVWVNCEPPLAIEVQRQPTDLEKRSKSHHENGARVLWLLPESADSHELSRALFTQPAARIRVSRKGTRNVEARPWEPDHTGKVWLLAGATVLNITEDKLSLESAGNYNAKTFLREVIEGARSWHPKETGLRYAGWARPEELATVRENHAAKHRNAAARLEEQTPPSPAHQTSQLEVALPVPTPPARTEALSPASTPTPPPAPAEPVIAAESRFPSVPIKFAPDETPQTSPPFPAHGLAARDNADASGTSAGGDELPLWRRLWQRLTGAARRP